MPYPLLDSIRCPADLRALPVSELPALAIELRADALAALAVFGERAGRLTQLADFICHRQF